MGTSNFLAWDTIQANVETDAQYASDALRMNGAPVGAILPSATFNKFAMQVSTFCAAFGQFLVNNGISASDSSQAALAAAFGNIMLSGNQPAALTLVPYSPAMALNAAATNGFYLSLTGNTSLTISGMSPGQLIAIYYAQDSVGGRMVTFPSNMVGAVSPPSYPNVVSVQLFRYDPNTSALLAAGPLEASGATYATSGVFNSTLDCSTDLNVFGTATITHTRTGDFALTTGAPNGAHLVGNGVIFSPRTLALNSVTGSRVFGVTYTNNSSAEMTVAVTGAILSGNFGQGFAIAGYVNGVKVAVNGVHNDLGEATVNFMVPVGSTYNVNIDNTYVTGPVTPTLESWVEYAYA